MNLLKALSSERTIGKSLSISHVRSLVLHFLEPKEALLMFEAASFYLTNSTKTVPFHGLSFNGTSRTLFEELHELYRNYAADMYSKFMSSLTGEWQGLKGRSQSVDHLFLTSMQLSSKTPATRRSGELTALRRDISSFSAGSRNLLQLKMTRQY